MVKEDIEGQESQTTHAPRGCLQVYRHNNYKRLVVHRFARHHKTYKLDTVAVNDHRDLLVFVAGRQILLWMIEGRAVSHVCQYDPDFLIADPCLALQVSRLTCLASPGGLRLLLHFLNFKKSKLEL